MVHPAQFRIMQNGNGWYWEVVTYAGEVIARGIAGPTLRRGTTQVRPRPTPRL